MFDFHLFALFMVGALALNLTPGPDMTFVLAQATHRGTRAGLAAALGIGAGTIVHMTLAAFGLAALFAAWPLAFDVVRYMGAAYLVWIAIGMLRRPPHLNASIETQSVRTAFRQGMLTNVLIPKLAIIFIAFLPQFVVQGAGPAWLQILLLGVAFDISRYAGQLRGRAGRRKTGRPSARQSVDRESTGLDLRQRHAGSGVAFGLAGAALGP